MSVNILIVSSREPVPVHRGDQKLLFHRIQELHRRGHRIFLCFVHSSPREVSGLDELRGFCVAIYPHRISSVRRALNLATRAASGLPLQVELFRDARLRSLVAKVIATEKIDVINAFLVRPFLAVEGHGVPLILDLVDSMHLNTRRRLDVAPRWLRPVLRMEASRLSRFEAHACSRAAASLVVSRADRDLIGAERAYVQSTRSGPGGVLSVTCFANSPTGGVSPATSTITPTLRHLSGSRRDAGPRSACSSPTPSSSSPARARRGSRPHTWACRA